MILVGACGSREEVEVPGSGAPEKSVVAAQPVAPKSRAPRPSAAPGPAESSLHLLRTTGSPTGPIPYELVEPAGGGPELPIVVGLHGRGDRAENFSGVFERLRLPVRAVVARAPMPWGQRGGRAWFDLDSPQGAEQLNVRVKELNQLLDHLKARYPQAPAPILLGFSQGAMLSLQMLARHPDRLGGIAALSGFLPLDDGNTSSTRAVPALLSMGDKDHLVTPDRTRAAAASLRALGHRVQEVSFPGGHAISREVMGQVRTFIRQVSQFKAP